MKRILAIMGSPRKNQNTDKLMEFLLEGISLEEFNIDRVNLYDLDIKNCTACDYCGHKGICIIQDDMSILYEKFDESDIIILGAPLYFNSLNGMTKIMIDRCQKYWSLKYSLGQNYKRGEDRTGIFLSVGGATFTHKQFYATIPIMDYFFKAINADYKANYFVSNTDTLPLKDRLEIKRELNLIGENISNIKNFHIQR